MSKTKKKPVEPNTLGNGGTTGANQDGKTAQQHHSNTVPPELFHDFEQAKYLYYKNPRVFAQLVAHLEKRAAEGLCIDQDTIYSYLRGHDFTTDEGEPFKVNHNYGAVWARLIKLDHPDLAPRIKLRASRFDRLFK